MKKLNYFLFVFILFGFIASKSQTSNTVILPVYSGLIKPDGTNEGGPLADQSGKKNRGFYTFDLSVIPQNAIIVSAELVIFSNNSTNTPEQGNSIVGIVDTPTLQNFEMVNVSYADANDGPLFYENATWSYSYNSYNLNQRALSEIQSYIGKTKGYSNFSFALRAASTTIELWNFHGYNVTTENVKPRMVLTYDETNNFPRAKFEVDKSEILVGGQVQFTDKSDNSPTSWAWDFDVDSALGVNTSTQKNPSFTFTKYGEYTISLMVSNSTGSNSVLKKKYINVYTKPVASFSFNFDMDDSLLVHFKDLSTFMPRKWLWDFGDGTVDSIQNPSHKYLSNGLYTVCLKASNIGGESMVCLEVDLHSGPMGIVNSMNSDVEIYPNPFTDKLFVNGVFPGGRLMLIDLTGKVIYEKELNNKYLGIEVNGLQPGFYFVKYIGSDGSLGRRKMFKAF